MAFGLGAIAQVNDAQLWENINLEKNINPRLILRLNHEGRITENITRPSYYYLDWGANYKISKHFRSSIAYVLAQKRLPDDRWSFRHQVYADIVYRKKIKNFILNDRQMFLWQVKDFDVSSTGRFPEYYLRNKITVKYDRFFKIAPYIAGEIYYKVNNYDYVQYGFNRIRYFMGCFFKKTEANEFEAYYLIERHFNVNNPQYNWIIGLGYTHTF